MQHESGDVAAVSESDDAGTSNPKDQSKLTAWDISALAAIGNGGFYALPKRPTPGAPLIGRPVVGTDGQPLGGGSFGSGSQFGSQDLGQYL